MRTLFLTGASGDIGRTIAEEFLGNGFQVISPTKQELNLENCEEIQEYIKVHKVECEALIHCAGFNEPKVLPSLPLADIQKTMNINCLSFIAMVKALSEQMKEKKYGRIVAVSSLYGHIARSGRMAYVSSKHALNGAMKTMACELGFYNILVNSLSPGLIDTKLTRRNNSPETIKRFEEKIPLKRLGLPEEVAKLAYFLCSSENSYITGQDIILDGGFMASGGQD